MKFTTLFLICVIICGTVLTATACSSTVTPAGSLTNVNFSYEDFSEIDISQGFLVTITRSDAFSINVTFDDALQEYFIIEQHGKVLKLGLDGGPDYLNVVRKAQITLPELRRLKISGMSVAEVAGFTSRQSIDLEISGGSSAKLENMVTGESDFQLSGESILEGVITMSEGSLTLSGASTATLDGSAESVKLNGSGESRFNMMDFSTDDANVKLSDASQASITIVSRLDLNLSGASHLEYRGDPLLREYEITGGSTVNHR